MMKEPPAVLLTDLAFNLLIFFVVCASTEPETARRQDVPGKSKDEKSPKIEQSVLVMLERASVKIDDDPADVPYDRIQARIKGKLEGKTKPEQRMVVVKTRPDTPYEFWVRVIGQIERGGGVVTLEIEEER